MRHRLVKLIVQPYIVADDGEHLVELGAQPIVVTAADLDGFPARLRAEIAALDTPADPPKPDPSTQVLPCSAVHPGQDIYHPEGHPATDS